MDVIIRVEPATATITVTEAVVSTTEVVSISQPIAGLAPLVMRFVSLNGCSVSAVPNPNQFAKEGV